jgi:hypothetical protein
MAMLPTLRSNLPESIRASCPGGNGNRRGGFDARIVG